MGKVDFVAPVKALDYVNEGIGLDSFEIEVLPFDCGMIHRIGANPCGKIFDCDDFVVAFEKTSGESGKIEPFEGWLALKKSKVKVETVDVNYCFLHGNPLNCKGSGSCDSEPRPASAEPHGR